MINAAIAALALARPKAGRRVMVLRGALRFGESYEAGWHALRSQLGEAGAQAAIAAANDVLRHLDAAGSKVSEALVRSGAANSPVWCGGWLHWHLAGGKVPGGCTPAFRGIRLEVSRSV